MPLAVQEAFRRLDRPVARATGEDAAKLGAQLTGTPSKRATSALVLDAALPLPVMPVPEREAASVQVDDPEQLRSALMRLRTDLVWTVPQARAILGPLQPLAEAEWIIVAESAIGPLVCLGREGRRWVQANPYQAFSVEPLENLLYFRRAAAHYGWQVDREPPVSGRRRMGRLDRLGVVREDGKKRWVMARATAGGYAPEAVTQMFNFIQGFLISDDAGLLVITPDLGKTRRMHRRRGLLEVREFRVK